MASRTIYVCDWCGVEAEETVGWDDLGYSDLLCPACVAARAEAIGRAREARVDAVQGVAVPGGGARRLTCPGTAGAASWGRCTYPPGHDGRCEHDPPAPRIVVVLAPGDRCDNTRKLPDGSPCPGCRSCA